MSYNMNDEHVCNDCGIKLVECDMCECCGACCDCDIESVSTIPWWVCRFESRCKEGLHACTCPADYDPDIHGTPDEIYEDRERKNQQGDWS